MTEYGVSLVGGCCGTTPEHLKAVSERVAGLTPSKNAYWQQVHNIFPGFDFEIKTPQQSEAIKLKGASSLYQFVPYEQDLSFLIIGERTNANGSRRSRDMLAAENWGGLTELAESSKAKAAHD
ncbi:MAG: homocysteine S-methyltransferase family protein [Fimbriimonadaceae bacterium]